MPGTVQSPANSTREVILISSILIYILMIYESERRLVVSDSLSPHELYGPRNSPGQNAGMDSLSLLQGISPTQGSNPGLRHSRQILYQLIYQGSPLFNLCEALNLIYLIYVKLNNNKTQTQMSQFRSLLSSSLQVYYRGKSFCTGMKIAALFWLHTVCLLLCKVCMLAHLSYTIALKSLIFHLICMMNNLRFSYVW